MLTSIVKYAATLAVLYWSASDPAEKRRQYAWLITQMIKINRSAAAFYGQNVIKLETVYAKEFSL